MSIETRLARLRAELDERGLDYLLVTQPENRLYLTGFAERDVSPSTSAGWLVIGRRDAFFVTSFLYYNGVLAAVKSMPVVSAKPRVIDGVVEVLRGLARGRVGYDASWMTVEQHDELVATLGGQHEFVAASGIVEALREIKDESEIAALAAAVDLTDRAFEHVAGMIRPGMTEKQVAWEVEKYMREHGAEGVAFDIAVAAGPNSATPHHAVTEHPIQAGEPVWIDCGALLDGYCGDLTRSFCLGHADAKYHEIWSIVYRAQEAAEKGLRAGMTGIEGDALARDVIVAAGYGEAFGHTLGHGIGLAVHEGPRVSPRGAETLRPGMVASVEPGIYIAGWGGVRIEDLVVYEEQGVRVLSKAPKQVVIS
jgi:Xaa-Pro aminopeptidase